MCYSNNEIPIEDLRRELSRLRWEAEIREHELDRLYQQEAQLKQILYKTMYGSQNT